MVLVAWMLALAAERPVALPPELPELGAVEWARDIEEAVARGRTEGRPVLVLFDEIPGCETVIGFGRGALSHPTVVAELERAFVAVLVLNNAEGVDRRVLEAFGEPRWNNPVVRVLDAEGRPRGPRFAGPYDVRSFARYLVRALEASGRSPGPALARLAAGS